MAKRIMVVDDEEFIVDIIKKVLERDGYEVETYPGSQEALSDVDSKEIDLVISDCKMPEITGIEMIKKIKVKKPDIKVVFMSGEPWNQEKCRQEGFDHFLGKPFPLDSLRNKVGQLLEV